MTEPLLLGFSVWRLFGERAFVVLGFLILVKLKPLALYCKAMIIVKTPLIWLLLSSSFTHRLILHPDTWFLPISVDHAQLYPTLIHTHGGSLSFCTSFWSKNIGFHCNLLKQNKAGARGRNLFSFQPCFHSIIGCSLSEWRFVDLWLTAALFAFTHKQKSVSSSGTTCFVFLHDSFFLLLLLV